VLIIDVNLLGKHHVHRENLGTLKNGFKKLAEEISKEVANEILKLFQV